MDRRSFLSAAAIAPFVRVEQLVTHDDGSQLEMGDVVYCHEERWGETDEGLAMVLERYGSTYSVRIMPGSQLNKVAWWDRSVMTLVERGAYFKALP